MEAKFKVGDMVRVIDDRGGGKIGDVGKVTYVYTKSCEPYYEINGLLGGAGGLFQSRLELAPKFKVGDRVVMRDYMLGKDCCGTVNSVDGNGYVYATDWTVGRPSGHIHSADLEHASPTFKAGDVIRVTTDQDTWVYSGMVGTAIKTAKTNMQVDFGNDKVWWVDYVNAEAAPLRIEAGKYYLDTTGKRVGPMRKWADSTEHPWDCPSSNFDIYRADGSSDYSPNLVRELVIEVAEKRVEEPKFKVGDRVRATDGVPRGETGTVAEYDSSDKTYLVKFDEWTDGHGYDYSNWWVNASQIDLDEPSATNTAIVAKLTNGEPRPSLHPYVHANAESAKAEAQRLAGMTPGTEFAVYERVDIRKVEKKYDHEWQRHAAAGDKISAIRELRSITGLGLRATKDAVESWLQAA